MSKQGPHAVLSPLWQKQCWITPTLYFGSSDGAGDSCHGRGCLMVRCDGKRDQWARLHLLICFLLRCGTLCSDLIFQQLRSWSRRFTTKKTLLKSARSICYSPKYWLALLESHCMATSPSSSLTIPSFLFAPKDPPLVAIRLQLTPCLFVILHLPWDKELQEQLQRYISLHKTGEMRNSPWRSKQGK